MIAVVQTGGKQYKVSKGDEIQVGGVQHNLDGEQHDNGVSPCERAHQPNAKKQRCEDEIMVQRHSGEPSSFGLRMPCAAVTAPISAAVSSNASTSSVIT